MVSIAIQSAPFSLIVLFSRSEPSIKALKRLIQTNLTQKVTQLILGRLDMITIARTDMVSYPVSAES